MEVDITRTSQEVKWCIFLLYLHMFQFQQQLSWTSFNNSLFIWTKLKESVFSRSWIIL